MINRRLIALAIGFVIGICAAAAMRLSAPLFMSLLWTAGAVCLGHALWTVWRERHWIQTPPALIVGMPFIAGLCLAAAITTNQISPDTETAAELTPLTDDSPAEFDGWICAEPEFRTAKRLDLRVRVDRFRGVGDPEWSQIQPRDIIVVLGRPKSPAERDDFNRLRDNAVYGCEVRVKGIWTTGRGADNPGGFDQRLFMRAMGYAGQLKVYDWRQPKWRRGGVTLRGERRGNFFVKAALKAKKSFLKTFKTYIPMPECGLVSGATVGTRFALKNVPRRGVPIEDSFRAAGVGHVLAVSGLHISVVALLLFTMFKFSGLRPRIFAPAVIILLFAFAILTGARPSSMRATIMNAVIIFSFVYTGADLRKATFTGLAISALLILGLRPATLFSAGFLLSFGAVLSLALLTKPIDLLLRQARGATLILLSLLAAATLWMACVHWNTFMRLESWLLLAAAILAAVFAGSGVNRLLPSIRGIRLDRLPNGLRLFIAAQFAIQIGMMIPMSSYFFGNFPVGGVFVNFLAIPLIGVIVQLGILAGLAGMIPAIGAFLAAPLGGAAYFFSWIFIETAHWGAKIFPFPPTPTPSMTWLLVYYSLVMIILVQWRGWFPPMLTILHQIMRRHPFLESRAIPALALIVLLGLAGLGLTVRSGGGWRVDILAGSDTPVIVATPASGTGGAVVINGGDKFFTRMTVEGALKKRWATAVKTVLGTGHAAPFGAAAASRLKDDFAIQRIHLPAFKDQEQDDCQAPLSQDGFFAAIGEKWLGTKAADGAEWAMEHYQAYRDAHPLGLKRHRQGENINLADGVTARMLLPPYRSSPAPVMLDINGRRILVVGDPGAKLRKIPPGELSCDILIIAAPRRGGGKYYGEGLAWIADNVKPKDKTIYCFNGAMAKERDIVKADEYAGILERAGHSLWRTDRKGSLYIGPGE